MRMVNEQRGLAWIQRIQAVCLLCVLGCAGSDDSKDSGAALTDIGCNETVITPQGPAPTACGHQIPNGAIAKRVDGGGLEVVLDGSVIASYPPCACDAGTGAPTGRGPAPP